MSLAVHVFIATTSGLVAIRGIQHRHGASLASFVTVAGGSKVAAITPRYRQFVNPDTSPIPGYFTHDSYHMVIDTDINQGESWQLGCAIAHLLYMHDRLGSGEVEAGDSVIVATGEVETGNAKIRLITHLAQKCLQAQKQILLWQRQHCRLSFLVPEENYKQPLPDIPFVLSPVSSMAELETLMASQGLIPQNVTLAANVHGNTSGPLHSVGSVMSAIKGLSNRLSELPQLPKPKAVNAGMFVSFKTNRTLRTAIFLIVGLIGLWSCARLIAEWLQEPSIAYEYELKRFDSCNDRQAFKEIFLEAQSTQLEAVSMSDVCAMRLSFLHFASPPKTVWLVADSLARINLTQSHEANASINTWEIPIPTWQQESRHYILMAFETSLDVSDEQSLDAYLLTVYEQQKLNKPTIITTELLNQWTSKQGLSATFISQNLKK